MQPDISLYTRPVEIFQRLMGFNTTNPSGKEAECIGYTRGPLTEAGIEPVVSQGSRVLADSRS